MAISERSSFERYRFYLQNASKGLLELRYAPGGWGDAKYTLKRNAEFMGIVRSISFNELSFVKDARDYVRDVYEMQGIDGKITFTVTRLNDLTGVYDTYFTGKLDLSVYKISETEVTCQVLDTSFAEKVNNRMTQKVNIRQRTTIEGFEVPAFSTESPELTLPDYNIQANAAWGDRLQMTSTLDNHYVPLWEGVSEFTETHHQDCTVVIADDGGMFINSASDRNIHMTGRLIGQITFATVQPHVTFRIRLFINGVEDAVIGTVSGSFVNSLIFDFSISEDFTVLTGQDFDLRGSLDHSGETEYTSVQVSISETQVSVPGGQVIAYPIYEALQRCIQLITDTYDSFHSSFFGRTDSEITAYGSDGQLGHISKGLNIRNAENYNNTISFALKDAFSSLSGIFCLGMGIESISGTDKVVIEELSYFFDSAVVLDLTSAVREAAVGKEVISERHFAQIVTGYQTYEYTIAGGLAEYNTKSEFSTVLSSVDNKLDLSSKFRADTQGIMLLRQNTYSDSDVKGDEDIFIIDSIRRTSPYTGFQARTDEDFILVTGGADAENSLNLDLTPKRNLLRNGLLVRAGLQKNLGTYLRWQAGDKNTTLATQRTAEAYPIKENADVLVNDLEEPFFLPELYTFECVMRNSDLETIKTNPKGLIKVGSLYGWIWELNTGSEIDKAEVKLLRANLNVITPT